jgi:hypothetical protein
MSCKGCGLNHSGMIRCDVFKRQQDATNKCMGSVLCRNPLMLGWQQSVSPSVSVANSVANSVASGSLYFRFLLAMRELMRRRRADG